MTQQSSASVRLVDMIAQENATALAGKVIIIRSPPSFGNPAVVNEAGHLHHDFHAFNKVRLLPPTHTN